MGLAIAGTVSAQDTATKKTTEKTTQTVAKTTTAVTKNQTTDASKDKKVVAKKKASTSVSDSCRHNAGKSFTQRLPQEIFRILEDHANALTMP